DLQLRVATNDTQTTEQLNNLSNIANGMETTRLMTERALIDIEYRIIVLERQQSRMQALHTNNHISREEFESVTDELAYQRKIHVNTTMRKDLEDRIRGERMTLISEQIQKLEQNLELAMSTFENLLVRAPVAGQLTSLPVQIGESMSRGQRLGQIDVVDEFRIQALVDEFYVTRVAPGQSAGFTLGGQRLQATVIKVYPEITQGTFAVDLQFDEGTPNNVRRGQTLQLELTLGNPIESILLPLGGFAQDTGGNWVFLLDADQRYATRREISTGRRNNRFIEVREGLEAGERVITSSYGQMREVERIELRYL
ncbi:MAG: HlyD family efflux transporter periplasmic adaptor subunit, partial [Pseudohongiella sp.]|nr:HlyD family efflux transporter periplasmic adaptor subunit [Pseudohongiella sp.]